ncbi:hypothetical protein PVK06_017367 [Gossypium arboreum]|uniref:Uncharacterized protein n=1 Tax=Gossypium arboreum TaxID=29729 RepID=A0ABR0Q3F4_GOSAR|nr:hypothetical protein PVK06_017367 [Gossypium arboreum]
MSMGLCNSVEDFLVLCPAHSSVKFPSEKSRKAHFTAKFPNEKLGNYLSADDKVPTESGQLKSNTFCGQPENKKDWVFCGYALSPEEKVRLDETYFSFAKMIGVTVSKFWRPDVTHVIASTDENGACTRTLKVLMAILNGKWVLKLNFFLLEARKLASQYQKEADKCNSGMGTYQEVTEKAEEALSAQMKLTAMWEIRARQKGWREKVAKSNAQIQVIFFSGVYRKSAAKGLFYSGICGKNAAKGLFYSGVCGKSAAKGLFCRGVCGIKRR